MGRPVRQAVADVENETYYRLPHFLFMEEFAYLTNDARVLYATLLDLLEASVENGCYDECGNVSIDFEREKYKKLLRMSDETIIKTFTELLAYELLEYVKKGDPSKFYLLHYQNPGRNVAANGGAVNE